MKLLQKPAPALLLIARKHGSSASRRQRGFETEQKLLAAVARWQREGFTVFWHYGPYPGTPTGMRPLLRQWVEGGGK